MHIELRDIRKYFGSVKANDGISLEMEGSRIFGLLGENGAGKSTLMKILSGYQPPDSGAILLDAQQMNFSSPAAGLRNGVGMLYQDPLDFPPFRLLDNYLLGRDKKVIPNRKTAAEELNQLTRRYGFELDLQAHIDSLSLGERQQLELIRLLAGGAQVLILDEPTTGISAEQKEKLFGTIRKLSHEEGKTVILVSHKLDEIQDLCDEAFVLRKGRLVGHTNVPCPNELLVEMMFGQVPARSERPQFQLGKAMLELQDVTLATYRLTVKDINLTIHSGEVFGLAGLEGSGQRLLMQACAGLLHPASGKITLDSKDVTHWSYHRLQQAGMAYITAGRLEEGLVAGLSLTEHMVLAQPEHTFMVHWNKARQDTIERIDHYQIVGAPETTADELSGGNQQRLLFALLNSPLKLLLLEHPTRGLDIRSANWIWELLYRRRQDGSAILFMSADLDEIIERSDRIAVFSGGVMSRIVNAKETSVEELGYLIGGQA
ncbi:MAG: ATP-binding cassette domain-containing protein [Anaerolineales bacterium]|nr:ATP-binding cassette domain-containing protein [Anaerolineales bacterium]